jgi:VanZ family protein
MKESLKILFIIQWIIASAIIFYLSSLPKIEFVPEDILRYDKIVHFFVYLIYGLSTHFFVFALIKYKIVDKKTYIIAMLIAVIYAASDEFHQSFVPNRTASFYDFLADFFGILLSIQIFTLILKKINKFILK